MRSPEGSGEKTPELYFLCEPAARQGRSYCWVGCACAGVTHCRAPATCLLRLYTQHVTWYIITAVKCKIVLIDKMSAIRLERRRSQTRLTFAGGERAWVLDASDLSCFALRRSSCLRKISPSTVHKKRAGSGAALSKNETLDEEKLSTLPTYVRPGD